MPKKNERKETRRKSTETLTTNALSEHAKARRESGVEVRTGKGKRKCYLLISFQLLHKSAFMEKPLQPVLSVVVAQLLKGGPSARPTVLRVLEARSVHNHHGTE